MSVDLVKVRASVSLGSLTVVTPYIVSFNVHKTRGQISTFDATLKVTSSEIATISTGGMVVISAGENSAVNKIFTGILKKFTMSPCWDDAGRVLLNISGTDILSFLEGKKYSRRVRSTKSCWVSIDSVTRKGPRAGKFKKDIQALKTVDSDIEKATEPVVAVQTASGSNVVISPATKQILVEVTEIAKAL